MLLKSAIRVLYIDRAVGVCCPNNITTSEHYNENIFAASAQNSVVVPPPAAINSLVSVPDTDITITEGSLESLGEVVGEFVLYKYDMFSYRNISLIYFTLTEYFNNLCNLQISLEKI